jgi:hypothetical protein
MAVIGLACLQGERLVAVFYPFGHPTPYAYENEMNGQTVESPTTSAANELEEVLQFPKKIVIINLVDKGK